jgi:uncharacterized damage-inducible protein DinB
MSEDWPPVRDASEAGWRQALSALDEAQHKLEAAVESLTDARLSETVQGERPYSLYSTVHGVIQHTLYHAGQIALLKRG